MHQSENILNNVQILKRSEEQILKRSEERNIGLAVDSTSCIAGL